MGVCDLARALSVVSSLTRPAAPDHRHFVVVSNAPSLDVDVVVVISKFESRLRRRNFLVTSYSPKKKLNAFHHAHRTRSPRGLISTTLLPLRRRYDTLLNGKGE